MNTETWLRVALQDLPPQVLQPLRREYLEHLAEAQAGGMNKAEALATLGEPGKVNWELHRLYGLGPYSPGFPKWLWWVPLVFWALPSYQLFGTASALLSPVQPWVVPSDLIPHLLILSWLTALWILTARLGEQRRISWRFLGGFASGQVNMVGRELFYSSADWKQEHMVSGVALILFWLTFAYLNDRRLRRIERLTGRPA